MSEFLAVPLKARSAVFVTFNFDLLKSNCFGELTLPIMSRSLTLTFTNMENGSILKFGPQIQKIANIDLGITPKL